MDINLPLILFLATAITGFFWLVDIFFLRKERQSKITTAQAPFSGLSEKEKDENEAYQTAIFAAAKEPLVIEYSKSFFPVLALVFVLRSFLFEPFQIPSESMLPALEVGDFILVNKFAYGIRLPIVRKKVVNISDPKRGDVMVFFPPNDSRYFIKRVIGLPNDKITYTDNVLYINDEKIEEEILGVLPPKSSDNHCFAARGSNRLVTETIGDKSYTARKCTRPGGLSISGTWLVPDGHYFMMGDNRDNSRDSREWLYVPEENIVGNAVAIWMTWESVLSIPRFDRVGAIE